MSLAEVDLPMDDSDLSDDGAAFLREADSRIGEFLETRPILCSGFVPSDYACVYRSLRTIAESHVATGRTFCEWGSGFGAVASLASMLEFDACGIEIQGDLVDAARKLADDFDLSVEFAHGSFIPPGAEGDVDDLCIETADEFAWLDTHTDDAYDQLGLEPDDFDLIFAYSWPSEEPVIENLFETFAANGALLLTHDKNHSMRLRRKVNKPSRHALR